MSSNIDTFLEDDAGTVVSARDALENMDAFMKMSMVQSLPPEMPLLIWAPLEP